MTIIISKTADRDRAAEKVAAIIRALPLGKAFKMDPPTEYRKTRSSAQNNYLFGVCYPLLAEAKGYTVEDIHEWMCGKHFGWVDRPCPKTPRNPDGIESRPFRTTTRDENGKRSVLTTMQFMDFVAMVQQVAAEVGVYIPDPQEEAA